STNSQSNIKIEISNSIATLIPEKDFYGQRNVVFTVTDSGGLSANSNTIVLTVNNLPETEGSTISPDSKISTDSSAIKSTLRKSEITASNIQNSTIENSRVSNSVISDSFVDPSNIIRSTVSSSTVIDSNITDSVITNSNIQNMDLKNAVVKNNFLESGRIAYVDKTYTGPKTLDYIKDPSRECSLVDWNATEWYPVCTSRCQQTRNYVKKDGLICKGESGKPQQEARVYVPQCKQEDWEPIIVSRCQNGLWQTKEYRKKSGIDCEGGFSKPQNEYSACQQVVGSGNININGLTLTIKNIDRVVFYPLQKPLENTNTEFRVASPFDSWTRTKKAVLTGTDLAIDFSEMADGVYGFSIVTQTASDHDEWMGIDIQDIGGYIFVSDDNRSSNYYTRVQPPGIGRWIVIEKKGNSILKFTEDKFSKDTIPQTQSQQTTTSTEPATQITQLPEEGEYNWTFSSETYVQPPRYIIWENPSIYGVAARRWTMKIPNDGEVFLLGSSNQEDWSKTIAVMQGNKIRAFDPNGYYATKSSPELINIASKILGQTRQEKWENGQLKTYYWTINVNGKHYHVTLDKVYDFNWNPLGNIGWYTDYNGVANIIAKDQGYAPVFPTTQDIWSWTWKQVAEKTGVKELDLYTTGKAKIHTYLQEYEQFRRNDITIDYNLGLEELGQLYRSYQKPESPQFFMGQEEIIGPGAISIPCNPLYVFNQCEQSTSTTPHVSTDVSTAISVYSSAPENKVLSASYSPEKEKFEIASWSSVKQLKDTVVSCFSPKDDDLAGLGINMACSIIPIIELGVDAVDITKCASTVDKNIWDKIICGIVYTGTTVDVIGNAGWIASGTVIGAVIGAGSEVVDVPLTTLKVTLKALKSKTKLAPVILEHLFKFLKSSKEATIEFAKAIHKIKAVYDGEKFYEVAEKIIRMIYWVSKTGTY
ncbi:MAG: hypothetical protein HY512_01970, partial [Candidatus Aenigmarchaeota archaeon]|nr:hypothetical protein [Candidatus Aenigmarchaeota archaeon]